jgi:CheY-like chemotaxis protein
MGGSNATRANMENYALIVGSDADATEVYADLVRAEGMEGVVAHDADHALRIVAERGRPQLFIVDLGMARDGGFSALRRLKSAFEPADCPSVLALVTHELLTTAGDLTDALGISEVLVHSSGEQVVRAAIRRTLARDVSGRYPVVATVDAEPWFGRTEQK